MRAYCEYELCEFKFEQVLHKRWPDNLCPHCGTFMRRLPWTSNLLPFSRRTSPTPSGRLVFESKCFLHPSDSISSIFRPILFLSSPLSYPKRTSAYHHACSPFCRSIPERACQPFPLDPTVGLSQIASCPTTALMPDFEMYVGNRCTTNILYQHHQCPIASSRKLRKESAAPKIHRTQ